MRTKNTLIMAFAAVLLAVAVYFLEIRGVEEHAEVERVANRLLSFESESVTGLNIKTADASISLQRIDSTWRITAPLDLEANESAVVNIVNRLQTTDYDRLIAETPDDLGRFGLADPEVEVTIELDDGSAHSLALGDGTPVGSNLFVRHGEGEAVYTTAAGLEDAVNKSLFDLRNRSIMAFDEQEVTRLELTTANLEASMQRQPALSDGIARWKLDGPIEARADADAIGAYLTQLRNDEALAYPSESIEDEDLSIYGLDTPQLTVRIWTNDDSTISLEIGNESEEPAGYYARRIGSGAVFVVPTALFDEAPDSITALRNRTVAEFARDRVNGIQVEIGEKAVRLTKDGIDWKIVSPRFLEGDTSTVSSLLTATLAMKAADFASATASATRFGFSTPYARVVFNLEPLPSQDMSTDQPAETITMLIGNETQIEPTESGPAVEGDDIEEPKSTAGRYITLENEPTVYVVASDDFSDITVDLFALRSKTLVSFARSDVSRIEVSDGARTYTLTKDEENNWNLSGPIAATNLTKVVDDMLWSLNYLRMEGIAAEPEGNDTANLASFGLDAPAMSVRAFAGEGDVAHVSIGSEVPAEELEEIPAFAPKAQTYGAVDGTPGIFRLDAKLRDVLQAIFDELS